MKGQTVLLQKFKILINHRKFKSTNQYKLYQYETGANMKRLCFYASIIVAHEDNIPCGKAANSYICKNSSCTISDESK